MMILSVRRLVGLLLLTAAFAITGCAMNDRYTPISNSPYGSAYGGGSNGGGGGFGGGTC